MQDLIIEKSTGTIDDSPKVYFLSEKGECILEGHSYMRNPVEFYEHLYDWLQDYFNYNTKLKFIFKLTYFNTSSNKMILDLLNILKEYKNNGEEITIKWHYDSLDENLEEDIHELIEIVEIDIKLIDTDDMYELELGI